MRVIRAFFILLLAASAIGKLADMPGFVGVVASYQSLPEWLLVPSAWALTLTELALSLWLLSGWQLKIAATGVIGLHLMYLLWLLMALYRGLDLPNCGCFGVYFARPLRWFTPLEDTALLGLAVGLWAYAKGKK